VPLKPIAILYLLIAISSCASAPGSWPDILPPLNNFQANWSNDTANQQIQSQEEYLLWVRRFYEGFNTVPGWLDLEKQVLARLPQDEQAEAAEKLAVLGITIGGEWAKDNSVRRIDTSTVATWRDALQESLSRMELSSYLMLLNQDIAALLNGSLTTDDITFERYYTDEFDF
jgi:hypothetical protein